MYYNRIIYFCKSINFILILKDINHWAGVLKYLMYVKYEEVFMNYYNEIKKELINNEVYKKVKDYSKNRSDLNTYYKVGKLLNDAGKSYGEGIIKKYSDRLTK